MAEDNRSRDDRDRQEDRAMHGQSGQGYGQQQYGQGPASYGPSVRQDEHGQSGFGAQGYGEPQGRNASGQNSYGQAGGYNQGFAGSDQGGGGRSGGQYGQTGWQGQQSGYGGPQSYGGDRTRGFSSQGQGPGPGQGGQSYTGQTGTGYGQTPGGPWQGGSAGVASGGDHQSLWDRTKSFFSNDEPSPPQGSHRGRGPKSYSRSDERIRDDVNDRLTDDPFLDAGHIEVAVESGEVTLSGTVSSRPDKRRAEDLADNVSGVKHTQNNLRVESVGAAAPIAASADPTVRRDQPG